MTPMKKTILFTLFAPVFGFVLTAQAADVGNGRELATKKYACMSCHGEGMNKPIDPTYPKLAGQYPDYIAQALRAYQRGGEGNGGRGNVIMAGQAKPLSRKEITDISAYIASLPGDLIGGR